MSFTAAEIATMEDALKNGELEVQHGDRRVRYRSIDELMKALSYAKRQQQGVAAGKRALANWS